MRTWKFDFWSAVIGSAGVIIPIIWIEKNVQPIKQELNPILDTTKMNNDSSFHYKCTQSLKSSSDTLKKRIHRSPPQRW